MNADQVTLRYFYENPVGLLVFARVTDAFDFMAVAEFPLNLLDEEKSLTNWLVEVVTGKIGERMTVADIYTFLSNDLSVYSLNWKELSDSSIPVGDVLVQFPTNDDLRNMVLHGLPIRTDRFYGTRQNHAVGRLRG